MIAIRKKKLEFEKPKRNFWRGYYILGYKKYHIAAQLHKLHCIYISCRTQKSRKNNGGATKKKKFLLKAIIRLFRHEINKNGCSAFIAIYLKQKKIIIFFNIRSNHKKHKQSLYVFICLYIFL